MHAWAEGLALSCMPTIWHEIQDGAGQCPLATVAYVAYVLGLGVARMVGATPCSMLWLCAMEGIWVLMG